MPRIRKNYRFSPETIGYLTWLTGLTQKEETAIVEEAILLLANKERQDDTARRGLTAPEGEITKEIRK